MDVRTLIGDLLKAAKTAASVIPGTTDDAVIGAAEKLADILGALTPRAPDNRTQEEMQDTRRVLAAAVSAKAERTADRFD